MKPTLTTFIFTLTLLFTFISTAEAQNRIWIVNNNPSGAGHYSDAQAAYDNATEGDTLYLVPSTSSYSLTTADKEIHVFGNGYFLFQNDFESANNQTTRLNIDNISGDDSSYNSIIINSQGIELDAERLTFKNIYTEASFVSIFNTNPNGLTVIQSIFGGYSGIIYDSEILTKNIFISNSLIKDGLDAVEGTFKNNIVDGYIESVKNSIISNNIFLHENSDGIFNFSNSNNVSNNILVIPDNEYPGESNQFNVDASTLFIGPDGNSTDAQWQLSESSPAKGAGTNGDDAGMFGGPNPYVLSGIPAIPRITEFAAPSAGSGNSGLPVSITIESKN